MHRFRTAPHHPPQQTDKQLDLQPTVISAVPEPAAGSHRRGRADRLPLARALNHRRLPLLAPGLAVHGIGTKPRLVPEIDFATDSFGLPRNGGEPFAAPLLDRLRIALIGSLQRLLRCQSQLREQFANRRHAHRTWSFSSIRLATIDRVHNPKSKPY